jgi:hypothetical protein
VGQSPFNIKGTVLCGLLEYLEAYVPGGLRAVKLRLPSDEHRQFCDQTFLASGWYDFLPVLELLAAGSAASYVRATQLVAAHAAWQAERDMRGVHRLLLKLASPEAVAERFPVVFARYFDFASVSVKVSKGISVVQVRGLPAPLFEWYKTSVGSAAEAILGVAGAKRLTCRYSAVQDDAPKHETRTLCFSVTRTWTR